MPQYVHSSFSSHSMNPVHLVECWKFSGKPERQKSLGRPGQRPKNPGGKGLLKNTSRLCLELGIDPWARKTASSNSTVTSKCSKKGIPKKTVGSETRITDSTRQGRKSPFGEAPLHPCRGTYALFWVGTSRRNQGID